MQTVTSEVHLRPEAPEDVAAIRDVIASAFLDHPHSRHTEGQVVDALRRAGALALSVVAHRRGQMVGHVAFSPVHIAGGALGWYCLAPLSVLPGQQGVGVGSALVWHGLLMGTGMLILFRHRASLGGFNVLVLWLQERFGWRAGHVQMAIDLAILLAASGWVEPQRLAWSVLGAVALNFALAVNHRPDRYLAV